MVTAHRARHASQNAVANRSAAIRIKNRFWRAAMRRKAGRRKNFFIAKNIDSESVQPGFRHGARDATTSVAREAPNASITK
jgi:hypothetical protein